MRRLLTLVGLLTVALPAGISFTACTRNPAANFCNGLGFGPRITDVATITLSPQTTGISMAFGQTQQASGPQAKTCKGATASVTSYTYGTTNNQLVDISPTGNICAGTWNRNTGGGIANFTICNNPSPAPNTGGLPYGSAFITAAANGVTSNPVQVYVAPHVTDVVLAGPQQCISQGQLYSDAGGNPLPLDAETCYSGPQNQQYELCAPTSITQSKNPKLACKDGKAPTVASIADIPTCPNSIGTLQFVVGNSSIASINSLNNQITAAQPGTTVITASIAGSGSSAGYFSTCPPKSISVTLANGSTSGTVTQGVAQSLVTTVYDTRGNIINGLTLDYQSTNPVDTSAGNGSINANFPGTASLYAVCQPATCNPAPINVVGLNQTGLSISSNPVTVTTPGIASSYVWFGAPGRSQYFVPIELLTGTSSSAVRMPYVPNSMMMDQLGTNLYFGSSHELMVYSTATNSLSREDTSVPGVVLAVSPTNSQLLINDQARHLFYIYSSTGSVTAAFGGMGSSAAWTPDAKTLYIADNANLNTPASCTSAPLITGHTDTLYVYNQNTGWTTYPLPPSPLPASAIPSCTTPPNVHYTETVRLPAVTNPSVGAYFEGNPTVAHTWCPAGTQGDYPSLSFYPLGDTVNDASDNPVRTDALTATTDGLHILGAAPSGAGIQLSDIGFAIPKGAKFPPQFTAACQQTGTTLMALALDHTLNQAQIAANATAVNTVISSPPPTLVNGNSSAVPEFAFVTYYGDTAGAKLPYYVPNADPTLAGTVGYVTLNGANVITAPVAGAFSPDNTLFFASTSGDNKIHYITIPVTPTGLPVDSQQFSPSLPACIPQYTESDPYCANPITTPKGTIVPATVITVKPRSTT